MKFLTLLLLLTILKSQSFADMSMSIKSCSAIIASNYTDKTLAKARKLREQKDFTGAIQILEAAYATGRLEDVALYVLRDLYIITESYQKEIKLLTEMLLNDTENESVVLKLASAYKRAQRARRDSNGLSKAQSILEAYIEILPESTKVLDLLAEVHKTKGEFDTAVDYANKAIALAISLNQEDQLRRSLVVKTRIFQTLRDPENIKATLMQRLGHFPEDAETHYQLARYYLNYEKKNVSALRHADQSIAFFTESKKEKVEPWLLKIQIELASQMPDVALETASTAIDKFGAREGSELALLYERALNWVRNNQQIEWEEDRLNPYDI